MIKKIYIAGKVTGLPIAETTMKFGQAQKEIEAQGFEAVNPLAVVNDFKTPWQKAMKMCIESLIKCDAVVLLHDYSDSKGALIEMNLAQSIDMPVFLGTKNLKDKIKR